MGGKKVIESKPLECVVDDESLNSSLWDILTFHSIALRQLMLRSLLKRCQCYITHPTAIKNTQSSASLSHRSIFCIIDLK
jgi:hypothetical protein